LVYEFNVKCIRVSVSNIKNTTQLLSSPHFRNKMQQFIYEMKLIIIVLNVTNGTFIYSSGQPFKKLAPFSKSNNIIKLFLFGQHGYIKSYIALFFKTVLLVRFLRKIDLLI
jgi:hypothetical protein